MALSSLSMHCIGMAIILFAYNAYMLYEDMRRTKELWQSGNIVNHLGSEMFCVMYFYAATIIFALVFILGVIKRKAILLIPAVVAAAFDPFFDEFLDMRWDNLWYLKYGLVLCGLVLIVNPVVFEIRDIIKENSAKNKREERI